MADALPKEPDDRHSTRRVLHVSQSDDRVPRIDFYRGDDEPEKVLSAFGYGSSNVRGQTRRPERAVMTHRKDGTTSIICVIESRLGARLDPPMFTPERATRRPLSSLTPRSGRRIMPP